VFAAFIASGRELRTGSPQKPRREAAPLLHLQRICSELALSMAEILDFSVFKQQISSRSAAKSNVPPGMPERYCDDPLISTFTGGARPTY
jgi:hypothetical protein